MATPSSDLGLSDTIRGLVGGLEHALFNPEATTLTVVTPGVEDRNKGLPTRFARVAFMHYDAETDNGDQRPLSLAVEIETSQFDELKLASMPDENLKELGYNNDDGLEVVLIDRSLGCVAIAHGWYSARSNPPAFHTRGMIFSYLEHSSGTPGTGWDIIDAAHNDVHWANSRSAERPAPPEFQPIQAIAAVLREGQADESTIGRLAQASNEDGRLPSWSIHGLKIRDSSLKFVSPDSVAIPRSLPYFYGMFKRLIDEGQFAQTMQQWHQRGWGYTQSNA